MRFSSSLLIALPALALAQEQVPLADKVKGWFNKAQSYVSSAAPAAQSPFKAGANKIVERQVTTLELDTWQSKLRDVPASSSAAPDEWMIYITGGNTTCFGLCGNATKAWNESVAIFSAKPGKVPNLAVLDCEDQPVLCSSWSVGPPSLYYMLIPQPLADQSKPATPAYYIPLNRTTVNAKEITEIATKETYKEKQPYEGAFHPFDGILAQYNLAVPVGYAFWGFSKMPTWLPMIAISYISRSIMGRRMGPTARPSGAPTAAGAQ